MQLSSTEILAILKENGYVGVLFAYDDIRQLSEQNGYTLNDAQVEQVDEYLQRKHDANEGLNWAQMEYAIDVVTGKIKE